ncbi:unnamed protein product [Absidia cylindrospora]
MLQMKLAERYTDTVAQKFAVKIIPRNDIDTSWTSGLGSSSATTENKDPKDTPGEREQRTRREMTIMHLLQHPNICRLVEWTCEGSDYYMFLEYVNGGQLLDYIIRHGKLKEKQARKFSRQIVSALDYCHRNAIVHRDLKIENILITSDENIKIIDFGLSNFYSSKSLLNTFCGSLYFAAPELLRARDYIGPEVDIWSFGVVLFVLVCGRVPFDDTSLPVLHQKIKAGIVDYPDHLSKECVDLLSKILQVDPKRRESLAFVRNHPWMNKGYSTAINSHLLHRPPLDIIDDDIVQRMHEYGFGQPEDIHERLQLTLASQEYQTSSRQQQQQQQQQQQHYHTTHLPSTTTNSNLGSLLRWRRFRNGSEGSMLGSINTHLEQIHDPLVSIYFLVQERKALDEGLSLDNLYDTGLPPTPPFDLSAPSSPGSPMPFVPAPMIRSGSSFSNRPRWQTTLTRSKTDRLHHKKGILDTHQLPSAPASTLPRGLDDIHSATTTAGTSSLGRSNSLLQRSKSAAKRLGTMFQHHDAAIDLGMPPAATTEPVSPSSAWVPIVSTTNHQSISRSQSMRNHIRRIPSLRSPLRRSQDSPACSAKSHHQKQTIRMEDDIITALLYGAEDTNNSINLGNRHHQPKFSAHPQSLFRFNRRHLFRVSPTYLMQHLLKLLALMGVQTQPYLNDPYSIQCTCRLFVLKKLTGMNDDHDQEHSDDPAMTVDDMTTTLQQSSCNDNNVGENLIGNEMPQFTIMIYQARWAGGRLGIKLYEAEEETSDTNIYRSLYFMILRCIASFIDQHLE